MAEKIGRPTKRNDIWLEAAEKVILSEDVVLFTDEDLVDEINEQLDHKDQISQRTYQRWKKKVVEDSFDEVDLTGQEFCRLIKKGLRKQKKLLFNTLKIDDKWQRWAWILERKFDEWNLRHIKDITSSDGSLGPRGEHYEGKDLLDQLKKAKED